MAQIFSPGADTWLRVFLLLGAVTVVGIVLVGGGIVWSDYLTGLHAYRRDQPVPFSHKHHVGGLGIDCRYCHTTAETTATAGFPPTDTCMTCHSQIWTGTPMLAPVRRSLADGKPLQWTWVNKLPEFVYFNHSIHVRKGVACESCHGRVDEMPLMQRAEPFLMAWCLDCHRDPRTRIRPREHVFDMGWSPPDDRDALGRRLIADYHINVGNLTHCSICHR